MKVKELIEELQKYNPESEVVLRNDERVSYTEFFAPIKKSQIKLLGAKPLDFKPVEDKVHYNVGDVKDIDDAPVKVVSLDGGVFNQRGGY